MNIETIKNSYKNRNSLLTWILSQDKTQHIKMRYELEEEVKKGIRTSFKDLAELHLLNRLTSGDTQREWTIKDLKK